MALTVSARSRFTGPSTPNLIKGAAFGAALGIAACLTEYADYGRWLAVAGVLLLIVGLHRFGRMGPDDAIVFELPAPRKKKKRKKQAASSDAGVEASDPNSETEAASSDGDAGADAKP